MSNETTKRKSGDKAISDVQAALQDLNTIVLMKPKSGNRKSVLNTFRHRKTIREISDKKLPSQMLSNLLWAACGVNRKKGPFGIPGRTAATASNSQEIDLYVALQEGIYHYDPIHHFLIPIIAGDLRSLAIGHGQEKFGDKAPVRLIYVADVDKLANTRVTRSLVCRIPKSRSHITLLIQAL